MMPAGERRVLGGDLEKEEEDNDDEEKGSFNINGNHSTMQTFADLRKMALDITIQKTEAPAPHEKVVVGGEVMNFLPSVVTKIMLPLPF